MSFQPTTLSLSYFFLNGSQTSFPQLFLSNITFSIALFPREGCFSGSSASKHILQFVGRTIEGLQEMQVEGIIVLFMLFCLLSDHCASISINYLFLGPQLQSVLPFIHNYYCCSLIMLLHLRRMLKPGSLYPLHSKPVITLDNVIIPMEGSISSTHSIHMENSTQLKIL